MANLGSLSYFLHTKIELADVAAEFGGRKDSMGFMGEGCMQWITLLFVAFCI